MKRTSVFLAMVLGIISFAIILSFFLTGITNSAKANTDDKTYYSWSDYISIAPGVSKLVDKEYGIVCYISYRVPRHSSIKAAYPISCVKL